MRYKPHGGDRQSLADKTLELLRTNQMVVITGSNQTSFEKNCHVGKTTLAREVRDKILDGGQSVLWINIQEEMYFGKADADRTKKYGFHKLQPPKPFQPGQARICFIDEAQWLFPYADPALDFDLYRRKSIGLMDKFSKMYENGVKFVFITSTHPLNPLNNRKVVNREMIRFLIAPVIELDASTQFCPYNPPPILI